MNGNTNKGLKVFIIFTVVCVVLGGLIALSMTIVNNGVKTEDALGGTSRYVRSDIAENSERRGTEISNTNQASDKGRSEIPYESNIFVSDDDYTNSVSPENELYLQLGDGYDDVVPEAVEKDEWGNILIYGVMKDMWDNAKSRNNGNELEFKANYYFKKFVNMKFDDLNVGMVNKSIYLLSCEMSSYTKEDVANAKYEVSSGKDRHNEDIWYVSFVFNDGNKIVFEYSKNGKESMYVFKSSKFTDSETKLYKWVTSSGSGFSDSSFIDGMYVIGGVY